MESGNVGTTSREEKDRGMKRSDSRIYNCKMNIMEGEYNFSR
jgi:hypothetical protein